LFIKKKSVKSLGNKFMLGYLLGSIPWYLVMADKLTGHNYHQYPIAPMIIFFTAYLFVIVSFNIELLIKKFVKLNQIRWVFIIAFIMILYIPGVKTSPVTAAKDRMFNTQFLGLDIAGDYIRLHSTRDERFFHSSHQSFGVVWHADRYGYRPPVNLSELQWAEENRNIKWIFLYQWGLYGGISYIPALLQIPETRDYIASHYSLRQVGFEKQNNQWTPTYFLFQKGGSTNLSNLNNIVGSKPLQTKEYEFSYGKVQFAYVNLD
jgi:hypothetical protein